MASGPSLLVSREAEGWAFRRSPSGSLLTRHIGLTRGIQAEFQALDGVRMARAGWDKVSEYGEKGIVEVKQW